MNCINQVTAFEAMSPLTGEILGVFDNEKKAAVALARNFAEYGFTAFNSNFQPVYTFLDECVAFRITNYDTWRTFSFTVVGGTEKDKELFEELTADELTQGIFMWVNEEWAFVKESALRRAIEMYADEDFRDAFNALADIDDEVWGEFDPSSLLSMFANQ